MNSQTKVGLLFFFSLASIFVFVSFLGQFSFFGKYKKLVVTYNFAGGLEKGSHVRLMGVKVGKVEKVDFQPDYKTPKGEEVKLQIHIRVNEKAWPVIREDSRYYINLAGIIGEKYLEITPGSSSSAALEEGQVVRGEDPPRIDQLLSQGYSLAGKILEMVEDNEGSVVDTLKSMNTMVKNLNEVIDNLNHVTTNKKYRRIVDQIGELTGEMTVLMRDANKGDVKQILLSMQALLQKLEKIDEGEVRKFLQDEGIKARVSL